MPFKATNSKYYKVEIHLPAYGKTPRLSTGSTRKSTAKEMEQVLKKIAEDGYYELIEALEPESTGKAGRIDLPTLFRAWEENSLVELKRRLNAPPLSEGVRDFADTLSYDNHRRMRAAHGRQGKLCAKYGPKYCLELPVEIPADPTFDGHGPLDSRRSRSSL